MAEGRRQHRVEELIRDLVSGLLIKGFRDPRVHGFITVSKVSITADLRSARVFVSIFGEKSERSRVLKGLKNATGFIKGNIGKKLGLRCVPNLEFMLDETLDYAENIEKLLKKTNTDE